MSAVLSTADAAEPRVSRLQNRSIYRRSGQRTSIRLEPELWDALREIGIQEGVPVGELIQRVMDERREGGLTSNVRVYIVRYFRERAGR